MTEDKKKEEIAVIEINEEFMTEKLYEFRGTKVLLDADLAEVYGYELKAFNQQVKRNIERFQNDMMFQLSDNEVAYLRSQFVTANISSKSRSNPYVFTILYYMTFSQSEQADFAVYQDCYSTGHISWIDSSYLYQWSIVPGRLVAFSVL